MRRITQEECENRIKQRFPNEEFKIIKYNGLGQPGSIECLNCHSIIEVSKMSNFFAKNKVYGCKKCHGLWRQREIKLNKIQEKYDIIDTVVKETHTYYKVRCKYCGYIRETTLKNLITHLDCGCTTHVYRNRTGEEFIQECNQYYNNELELVGKYINQTTKVLLRHIPCGFVWSVKPNDIIHGRSHCPKCRTQQSLGVLKIQQSLDTRQIQYMQEYPLKDSRQRFDFYLPEYNIVIEYNGRQHYEYNKFFHKTIEGFYEYKRRDQKKQEYCEQEGIKLVSIPYTADNDIDKIVNNLISSTTKVNQVIEKATLPN